MTLIYFILVLGITVFIHELGHFIFAKKAGIYVYEFSIGMGPRILKKKFKNDETIYSIRLFPIGGFVSMAGEDIEEDKSIPEEKQMYNKTWIQRFLTIIAGVLFNFLLAIILLFIVALNTGAPQNKNYISEISKDYPIEKTNIEVGDKILKVNGKKVRNQDMLLLELTINNGKTLDITVEHKNKKIEKIKLKPKEIDANGEKSYKYGLVLENKVDKGIIPSIKYAFTKTFDLLEQMGKIIIYLITGKLSLNSLSGPVGIYNIVGESAKAGIISLIYLTAYLCINVGFINLIPIPAFDGGRALFLIIEKIRRKKMNPKIENTIHSVGFIFLMVLMVLITYNDIIRIFK
ncbi:MAG: RIP metalloprotease RseP [Bacilli bacterium]|nr:RIP metalloprotease RseP [Bacilli bacterium]